MLIYHATEKRNLKSIKKNGLKIAYDKKIYFAESLSSAYTWLEILSQSIDSDNFWVILKINLSNKNLDFNYLLNDNIKEITYNKNIRPDKIKVVKCVKVS